jgi:beta-N-acetylhexosaminidase
MMAIDQEGGRVQRLKSPLTVWPPMARVAARGDLALTEAVGRALGDELRLFGFNLDFAPVLDVHTNPDNQVIGDRSFGETPEAAARHALAVWRGLEASGVRGCGKHFPGHGDTVQDSHLELPRIDAPLERLRAIELAPFAEAVRAGVGMIMTAHIVFAGVDERPATMSRRWIDGVLRGELGFSGVVVSDDLDMKAVAGRFPVEEVVRDSLAAGVDAFLACRDPVVQTEAEEALARAARDAELGPRVAEAAARVRAFRARLAPARPASSDEIARLLPHAAHQALAARV